MLDRIRTGSCETAREQAKLCNAGEFSESGQSVQLREGGEGGRGQEAPNKVLDVSRLFKYVNNLC